uniref:AMP-binding domain-containing protein n=1 Tax=Rhabditophanes sp. KR3021 TaxID=114890 RepID=A0AC35TWZ7_9BILA
MDSQTNEKFKKEVVLSAQKPLSAYAINLILQGSFYLYDILNYLPFQLLANPEEKLQHSNRIKARNIGKNGQVIYRNVDVIGKPLRTRFFEECGTLGGMFDKVVNMYESRQTLGKRTVLEVINEKQEDGRDFQKVRQGDYKFMSYGDVAEQVQLLEKAFTALGVQKGDRVIIYAETRKEWFITALACFKRGLPIVTVYATLGEEAVGYAINESEGQLLITTVNHLKIAEKIIPKTPNIKNIIYFDDNLKVTADACTEPSTNLSEMVDNVLSFEDFKELGRDVEYVGTDVSEEDLAMVMYTSGTTANPKGVVLTHKSIIAAITGQLDTFPVVSEDTYIAFLPLAHIIEVCAELIFFFKGCKIGYSSPLTLIDKSPKIFPGTSGDTVALKPTVIACVPAIMNRISKAVYEQLANANPIAREIFNICYDRKRARYENGYESLIMDNFAFNKIKGILGGNVRLVLSGGAPLDAETQRFMNICFCCPVVQGYGLTETVGAATISQFDDINTGSVGAPLTCAEIMLRDWPEGNYFPTAEDPKGEILIHGPHLTSGYLKNEEQTNEAFIEIDGKRWFCSGDIGYFKQDGGLVIIDRKKDLVKINNGEYISLGKVESKILTNQYVDNVCVLGETGKDYIGALVVVNPKNIADLAKKVGIDSDDLNVICKDERIISATLKEIQVFLKGKLCRTEIPQRLCLFSEPWLPSDGLLTEAMKLKRRVIEVTFSDQIKKMMSI